MGGCSEFWKAIKSKREYAPKTNDTEWIAKHCSSNVENVAVIDAANILKIVTSTDRSLNVAKLFFRDSAQDRNKHLTELANGIERYMTFLPFAKDKITFTFELGRNNTKPAAEGRARNRASKISTAVNLVKLATAHGHHRNGMAMLNQVCGLVANDLVRLANLLQTKGFNIVWSSGEADPLLVIKAEEFSLAGKRVFIVSEDCDPMVFGTSTTAYAQITPRRKYRSLIKYDDVLRHLNINRQQLVAAVCVSGCDNVRGVHSLGWKTVMKMFLTPGKASFITLGVTFDFLAKNSKQKFVEDLRRCKVDTIKFVNGFKTIKITVS
jgi:hypothetical protein